MAPTFLDNRLALPPRRRVPDVDEAGREECKATSNTLRMPMTPATRWLASCNNCFS